MVQDSEQPGRNQCNLVGRCVIGVNHEQHRHEDFAVSSVPPQRSGRDRERRDNRRRHQSSVSSPSLVTSPAGRLQLFVLYFVSALLMRNGSSDTVNLIIAMAVYISNCSLFMCPTNNLVRL